MIIEMVAGEGYGPLRGVTGIVELVPVHHHGVLTARLTLEVGLTGQDNGTPLADERCGYLGGTALRELIIAAARALAKIEGDEN